MRETTQLKRGAEAENFYMYSYKIKTCPTKHAHDWTSCPYAHSGESARRRQPHLYKPIPCPESKGGNPCPRGDSCKYAHNDFEYWLHPARYKTEFCKQGPGCSRKICFFAHRPEEIRAPPPVVFTKQGPFIDSATTARNKHRLMENFLSSSESFDAGCSIPASPWNSHVRSQSGALSHSSSYGDAATLAVLSSIQGAGGAQVLSPRQPLIPFASSASMGTPPQTEDGRYAASMAEFQAALTALTSTPAPATPRTPFSEISPLGSLTPTTPWSISAQTPFNGLPRHATETIGGSEHLLTYLHGLQQAQQLSQTPRSFSEYVSPRGSVSAGAFQQSMHTPSASLGQDLVNLAQMIHTDVAAGDSVLFSSLSDGVIHRGGPSPGFMQDTPPATQDRA